MSCQARHGKTPPSPEDEVRNLLSRRLALPNFPVSASLTLEERVDVAPSGSCCPLPVACHKWLLDQRRGGGGLGSD